MALKTLNICSQCGFESPKWIGRCPSCQGWNTFVEDVVDTKAVKNRALAKPIGISKLSLEDAFAKRMATGIGECDRVLGGGLVHDSLTLLSGDPGIGKSTLALQIGLHLAQSGKKVIYVSGEESVSQISARAKRMVEAVPKEYFFLISSDHLEGIVETIRQEKPAFVVLDSVQTIRSEALPSLSGSIAQTRTIAEKMTELAKQDDIPSLMIGHVNKEGDLAGPKVLEHLVDTVLYLEGEQYQDLRILRSMKNRFGATTEIGVFSMKEGGLEEVKNPSAFFLQGRKKNAIGSALSVTLEGSRPFVIEIQALTNTADYAYPKRTSIGVDGNRVQLLTAVINKYLRLNLEKVDVYVSIAGGFVAKDPAVDLAIVAAIISSRKEIPLPADFAFIGEIGLSGEVRPAANLERRLKELSQLGLTGMAHQQIGEVKALLNFIR